MTGTVYDFDSLKVRIMSGEKRIMIFFKSSDEYEEALEMGMRINSQVIFDNETDKIEKFF